MSSFDLELDSEFPPLSALFKGTTSAPRGNGDTQHTTQSSGGGGRKPPGNKRMLSLDPGSDSEPETNNTMPFLRKRPRIGAFPSVSQLIAGAGANTSNQIVPAAQSSGNATNSGGRRSHGAPSVMQSIERDGSTAPSLEKPNNDPDDGPSNDSFYSPEYISNPQPLFVGPAGSGPSPGRNSVQSRDYIVAKWGKKDEQQSSQPDIEVWLVRCVAATRHIKAWALEGSPKVRELCNQYGYEVTRILDRGSSGGFTKGRPLLNVAIRISTCAGDDLPEFLYRVVHDGYPPGEAPHRRASTISSPPPAGNEDETLLIGPTPHGGLRARGYPNITTDPLYFQILLQFHFSPLSRVASPFMSTVDTYHRAVHTCHRFRQQGLRNIRVLKIRTTGPGWDPSTQRIWSAKHLIAAFSLGKHERCTWEYLIENSIPREAVVQTIDLREMERLTGEDFDLGTPDREKRSAYRGRREEVNEAAREARAVRSHRRALHREERDRTRSVGFGCLLEMGKRGSRMLSL